jgi:hypothetical protein
MAWWGGSHQPFRPAVFRGFRIVLCLRNVPTVTGIIVRSRPYHLADFLCVNTSCDQLNDPSIDDMHTSYAYAVYR